jgi:SAM-dependent methyltransferase
VNSSEAVALIAGAVPRRPGTWADLGAGDGTFTRALFELLGPHGRVYAVDRDARAVAALERWAKQAAPNVIPVIADFTRPLDLPDLAPSGLDGLLLANALHFVSDAEAVLGRLAGWVRPGGLVVVVEYDRRAANRWVPYPIPPARLSALAAAAGLSAPVFTGARPSAFGGALYVAAAQRPHPTFRPAPTGV